MLLVLIGFNTQPHGGGCELSTNCFLSFSVSTHSRTEAAAVVNVRSSINTSVSTHSRTEAAAFVYVIGIIITIVSTHSRTEAAAK